MDMEQSATIAQWVQAGGVVAFASLVYMELRAIRPIVRSLELSLQALLERERSRTGPIRIPGHKED